MQTGNEVQARLKKKDILIVLFNLIEFMSWVSSPRRLLGSRLGYFALLRLNSKVLELLSLLCLSLSLLVETVQRYLEDKDMLETKTQKYL